MSASSLASLFLFLICQDDESLRRWKEQLLGSVNLNDVGGENISSLFYVFLMSWFCFLGDHHYQSLFSSN